MPSAEADAYSCGSIMTMQPPARARSLSPSFRLRQAICTASRLDEHADVHGQRGSAQPHGVRDPSGAHAEGQSGETVRVFQGIGLPGDKRVIAVGQTDEHTGKRAGQRCRRQAGVFHGLP